VSEYPVPGTWAVVKVVDSDKADNGIFRITATIVTPNCWPASTTEPGRSLHRDNPSAPSIDGNEEPPTPELYVPD